MKLEKAMGGENLVLDGKWEVHSLLVATRQLEKFMKIFFTDSQSLKDMRFILEDTDDFEDKGVIKAFNGQVFKSKKVKNVLVVLKNGNADIIVSVDKNMYLTLNIK